MPAGSSRAARLRNTRPETYTDTDKEKGAGFRRLFVWSGNCVQPLFLELLQERHFGGGKRNAFGE